MRKAITAVCVAWACSRTPDLSEREARDLIVEALGERPIFCRTMMPVRNRRVMRSSKDLDGSFACVHVLIDEKLIQLRVAREPSEKEGRFHPLYEAMPAPSEARILDGFLEVRCGEFGVRLLRKVRRGNVERIDYEELAELDRRLLNALAPCQVAVPAPAAKPGRKNACAHGPNWSLKCP